MNIGTRSLLFGCHQVFLHPYYTWKGWVKMYGKAPLIMWIAFIFHDWGYWGMSTIDGSKDDHPLRAFRWVSGFAGKWWLGLHDVAGEILYHSRFFARLAGVSPSRLCWADKMGTALMPSSLWAVLAHLSGEGYIYMENKKYEVHKDREAHNVGSLIKFHHRYKRWARNTVWPLREVKK